jgi:uncharacterized alpha-E superfamily protein
VVAYRARFTAAPQLRSVLTLLLLEDAHPSSVYFQMAGIGAELANLDESLGAGPESLLHGSLPVPTEAQLDAVERDDAAGASERERIAAQLRGLAAGASALSDALSRRYFTHTESQLQSLAN